MNPRALEVRKQFLQLDLVHANDRITKREGEGATPDELQELAIEMVMIKGRIAECDSWLKVREKNPKFGESELIDGVPVPKMPTFGNPEAVALALKDPARAVYSVPADLAAAAREWRAGKSASDTAMMMDGKNPDVQS